ncbi:MAG TPA: peptidoglycan editing factor PgeF [Casimicrobiaceae bacterium]|jgi:hypothetical protein
MNTPSIAAAIHSDRTLSEPLAQRFRAAGLDWIVPQWPAPACVQAFVTTRNASASVDAFLPAPPVWLEQVHGADVIIADAQRKPWCEHAALVSAASSRPRPPRADAAVTRDANVVLAVRAADCLPVLLAERGGLVVGIAHAGWRGLAAGVLENAIAAMNCDPARIVAWFGPAIGRFAFEVGADVRDAFLGADSAAQAAFADGSQGKWFADLEALARMRLSRAGVTSTHGGGMCTMSDPARFFSFRRERATGRMAAFLWREDART